MKKHSFKLVLFASLLSVWMFSACNSDGNKSDADTNGMEAGMDTTIHSAADMPADEDYVDYSYNYVEGDYIDPATAEATKPQKGAEVKKTPAKLKVKDIPVIYTVSQTDRPPLFTSDCINAKNPQKCSNKALAEWAHDAVKYPEADLADGSDGLEYVTFVINQKGKVSSISRVDTKKEACEGCSDAVLMAVLGMPDWQPALLGGNPVNVVVTLPIRFKVI